MPRQQNVEKPPKISVTPGEKGKFSHHEPTANPILMSQSGREIPENAINQLAKNAEKN
jgi:hypothetical protein